MKRRSKTVFFGINSILPISIGGTEIYVSNLSKELIKAGWNVTIICGTNEKEINTSKWNEIKVYGIPIHKDGFLDKQFLRQIIISNSPNIFHLHSLGDLLNASHIRLLKNMGVKCFFTPHLANNFCISSLEEKLNGKSTVLNCLKCKLRYSNVKPPLPFWFIALLLVISDKVRLIRKRMPLFYLNSFYKVKNLKLLRHSVDGVVSLSPWMTNVLKQNKFKRIVEIPQGVNSSFLKEKNESISTLGKKKLRVAYIGRLSSEKSIEIILEASKILNNRIEVVVIGSFKCENEYVKRVINRAREIGAEIFLNLKSELVYDVMKNCDVLCLASNIREVAPLVVEEARAMGKPAIVSDINKYCFFNKVGLIFFRTNDPLSLASIFESLNYEELKRLKFSLKDYNADTFFEISLKHIKLYEWQ